MNVLAQIVPIINLIMLLAVVGALTVIIVLSIKLLIKKNKLADMQLKQNNDNKGE